MDRNTVPSKVFQATKIWILEFMSTKLVPLLPWRPKGMKSLPMTCLEGLFDSFHGPKIASASSNGVFEKYLDIFHDSFENHLNISPCPVSKSTGIFPW